jgi:dethiobiotin synthetase
MTPGIFVTGTDTGVGKTVASCALLRALAARGIHAMPMKPIAAGAGANGANEDTLALLEAAGRDPQLAADVTPVLLREAIAPHIAAAREGRAIELAPVLAAFERLRATADFMVVEGVGGFCVPLGDRLDTVDLTKALQLPVVLVVGLRLGCLNHALLTVQAISSSGLPFAGWIANELAPAMPAQRENIDALRARIGAPLLGTLPFMDPPDPGRLAASLDTGALVPATR